MSIINNMHKDLNKSGSHQPVLSNLPSPQKKQKVVLFSAIILLAICSLFLLSLIIFGENEKEEVDSDVMPSSLSPNVVTTTEEPKSIETLEITRVEEQAPAVEALPQQSSAELEAESSSVAPVVAVEVAPLKVVDTNKKVAAKKTIEVNETVAPKKIAETKKKTTAKQVVEPEKEPVTVKASKKKVEATQPQPIEKVEQPSSTEALPSGHLNIESAQLSDQQLANIYLKEADKELAKGESDLAAEKWQKALNVKPDLNDVRKALAMHYYSQDDIAKATSVLKKGALVSPEYSDFNLMLSRIALKEGDSQKAFLYLEQNPPEVEGHLDYYVSHAILAQKFKLYERSEELYQSLLSQQPENGRWLMSLAIAQDKQAKKEEASASYQKALEQTNLSINAKDYISKRLAFLNKE